MIVFLLSHQPDLWPAIAQVAAGAGMTLQPWQPPAVTLASVAQARSGTVLLAWQDDESGTSLYRQLAGLPGIGAGRVVIALVADPHPDRLAQVLGATVVDYLPLPLDPVVLGLRLQAARRWSRYIPTPEPMPDPIPEEALRVVLAADLLPLIVTRVDDGTVLYANESFGRVTGGSAAELIGRSSVTFYPSPEDREALRRQILGGGGVTDFVGQGKRLDGKPVWYAMSVRLTRIGELPVAVSTISDVTARKEAELALAASEARYRNLTESTAVGIWHIDLDGRTIVANQAMCELLEIDDVEALQDKTYRDFFTPDSIGVIEEQQRLRARGIGASFEVELLGAKGRHRHVIITGVPQRGDDGTVQSTIGTFVDITEVKRLKSHLILADRLASLGTLAAGMAHEINNPLTYVMGNLDLATDGLRRQGSVPPRFLDCLARAMEGIERIRAIVDDLSAYSRLQEADDTPVDVHRVLDSAIDMAIHQIRLRGQLVRTYGALPAVKSSASRLHQVFLNLLINAAQALPEGDPQRQEVRVETRAEDDWAVIEISDTGAGIAVEDQDRVFEPFFTTKANGRGTGLGLPICHSIVTGLGGEITLQPTSGRGATFRVRLPGVAEPAPPPAAAAVTAGTGRRGRLLVIDDEPQILGLVAEVLGDAHEVVTQASPPDGLAILLADPHFDLVLCDLMMPELTGMDLFAAAVKAHPSLAGRFVFLTAGTYTERARSFLEATTNAYLAKPFALPALVELVRSHLGRQA